MINRIATFALLCGALLYSYHLVDRRLYPQQQLTDNRMIGPEFWTGRKSFQADSAQGMIPRQLPGPADAWAGGEPKEISFPIPSGGAARILIYVLDSHEASPPRLSLRVNGTERQTIQIPKGRGGPADRWGMDAKPAKLEAFIPAALASGGGTISLVSIEGSWMALERIVVIHPIGKKEMALAIGLWLVLLYALLRPFAATAGWRKAPAMAADAAAGWAERAHSAYLPESARRSPWSWAMGCYTLAFLAVNHRLALGLDFPMWDGNDYFLPHFMLLSDYARQGRLMLWNPWESGGSPSFIEPQIGATSPVTMLFALLFGGMDYGYRFYWLFIWWLGGAGMILLARGLAAPAWAAPVIAMGYAFSGMYTGNGQHMCVIYSYSFFPLIIWRLDAALAQGRWTYAAQAGALWGLSGLAGYPLFISQNGEFAAVWVIGRVIHARSAWKVMALRGVKSLLIVLVSGTLILSPLIYSFVSETKGYSERSKPLEREFALTSNALHPAAMYTLASPVFPVAKMALGIDKIWTYNDISSMCIYTGAAVAIFALLALIAAPRDVWRWWLLFAAFLGLAIAMSVVFPFRGWMYDYIPSENYFRHPAMTRGYFLFFISVLAMEGAGELKTLSNGSTPVSTLFLISAFAASSAAALLLLAGVWSLRQAGGEIENATYAFHMAAVWGGAVLAAVIFRLGSNREGGRMILIGFISILALMDSVLNLAVSRPILFSGKSRYHDLDEVRKTSLDLGKAGFAREAESRDCFNMIIKVPAYMTYPGALVNNYFLWMFNRPELMEMYTGPGRIWFSSNPAKLPLSKTAYNAFAEKVRASGAPFFALHDPAAMTGPGADDATDFSGALDNAAAAERAVFGVIEYTPVALKLELDAPEDGWILVTERWGRSWKAWVNGRPAPIYGGNFVFRAVQASKGKNVITFAYEPALWIPLMALSWGLMALIAAFSLFDARRMIWPNPISQYHHQ